MHNQLASEWFTHPSKLRLFVSSFLQVLSNDCDRATAVTERNWPGHPMWPPDSDAIIKTRGATDVMVAAAASCLAPESTSAPVTPSATHSGWQRQKPGPPGSGAWRRPGPSNKSARPSETLSSE